MDLKETIRTVPNWPTVTCLEFHGVSLQSSKVKEFLCHECSFITCPTCKARGTTEEGRNCHEYVCHHSKTKRREETGCSLYSSYVTRA